jgi:hypothetical protein
MTEVEWLAHNGDPSDLLFFPAHRQNERKLRLFACGCVYRMWDRLRDERCRRAVQVGERLADGQADRQEQCIVLTDVQAAWQEASPPSLSAEEHLFVAARYTVVDSGLVSFAAANRVACSMGVAKADEQVWQSALFRDIFGNPFRPVTADPSWLTSTVVSLAEGIYADRAFDRLPILADALQDAGCADEDVLDHCRGAGPHVRGCWVVDLLLGKE